MVFVLEQVSWLKSKLRLQVLLGTLLDEFYRHNYCNACCICFMLFAFSLKPVMRLGVSIACVFSKQILRDNVLYVFYSTPVSKHLKS